LVVITSRRRIRCTPHTIGTHRLEHHVSKRKDDERQQREEVLELPCNLNDDQDESTCSNNKRRLFSSAFPGFVPSLSWQLFGFGAQNGAILP